MSERHYRLADGSLLCGLLSPDARSTVEPWSVDCRACLEVAAAESLEDRTRPHAFVHSEHCVDCLAFGPRRRRDSRGWDGSW